MSRLTPERVALAHDIMARYPVKRSALIPLIHLAQGDRNAALAGLHEALLHDPAHKEALSLSERLEANQ